MPTSPPARSTSMAWEIGSIGRDSAGNGVEELQGRVDEREGFRGGEVVDLAESREARVRQRRGETIAGPGEVEVTDRDEGGAGDRGELVGGERATRRPLHHREQGSLVVAGLLGVLHEQSAQVVCF